MLNVHCGQNVDAGVQQCLDVLPALGVPRARHVGVGQLVDHGHLGLAGQHGVHVHLGELVLPVRDPLARHDFQPVQQRRRLRPAMGLHEPHHDVHRLRSGGEHHDGDPAGLADLAADLESVQRRQHHVEDDHVERVVKGSSEPLAPVHRARHPKARVGQAE